MSIFKLNYCEKFLLFRSGSVMLCAPHILLPHTRPLDGGMGMDNCNSIGRTGRPSKPPDRNGHK